MLTKQYWLSVLLSLTLIVYVQAQAAIVPHTLELTYNKTSSIIFPTVIKAVDKGSRDLLAQKAKGVENVLQLKAARENFPETNLTVITADGILYQFTVNYARHPASLSFDLTTHPQGAHPAKSALIFQSAMTEKELAQAANAIVNTTRPLKIKRKKQNKFILALNGIYIQDDVIFYHFRLSNQSNINYDVSFLRLFMEDQVKAKRTASQEVDVEPIYIYGDHTRISGKAELDIVCALGKFTIPDAKRLVIEMFEHQGGRHLNLSIRNRAIVRARPVPTT